jgi:chorismate-pyruvate lyase
MHVGTSGMLHRERFLRDSGTLIEGKWEATLLRLLLAQDGSTTRLLETMTGQSVSVHVIDQHLVRTLPAALDGTLPGKRFLRRITSLGIGGQVLLDGLAYIAIDVLPSRLVRELEEGVRPIGYVLSSVWTRRAMHNQDTSLLEELWKTVGKPDLPASRSLRMFTPRGPCMLLAETFRRGVLAHVP